MFYTRICIYLNFFLCIFPLARGKRINVCREEKPLFIQQPVCTPLEMTSRINLIALGANSFSLLSVFWNYKLVVTLKEEALHLACLPLNNLHIGATIYIISFIIILSPATTISFFIWAMQGPKNWISTRTLVISHYVVPFVSTSVHKAFKIPSYFVL